jgi:hypothetical protein
MKSFSQYIAEATTNDLNSKDFKTFSAHDKHYSVHGKPNQAKAKSFADHLKSKGFTHSSSESTHGVTGEKITHHTFTHPKTNHKVYMSHGEKGNVREVQTTE